MKTYSILKVKPNNKVVVEFTNVTEEELLIFKTELKEAKRILSDESYDNYWAISKFRVNSYSYINDLADYGPILILEEINLSE